MGKVKSVTRGPLQPCWVTVVPGESLSHLPCATSTLPTSKNTNAYQQEGLKHPNHYTLMTPLSALYLTPPPACTCHIVRRICALCEPQLR